MVTSHFVSTAFVNMICQLCICALVYITLRPLDLGRCPFDSILYLYGVPWNKLPYVIFWIQEYTHIASGGQAGTSPLAKKIVVTQCQHMLISLFALLVHVISFKFGLSLRPCFRPNIYFFWSQAQYLLFLRLVHSFFLLFIRVFDSKLWVTNLRTTRQQIFSKVS